MTGMRTTLRKALICPFFGPQPEWIDQYWQNAERLKDHGYDFLLETDEDAFRDRVRDRLGIVCPSMAGTGAIWEFRPALGFLYQEEIKDFDFWGTTDFDVVFGRIEHFYPDSLLMENDIVTDHWEYLCGPWTLFRNTRRVNELFLQSPNWKTIMENADGQGWMEGEFTEIANGSVGVNYGLHHSWRDPHKLLMEDGALYHDGSEVSFHHFRHTKEWPL